MDGSYTIYGHSDKRKKVLNKKPSIYKTVKGIPII